MAESLGGEVRFSCSHGTSARGFAVTPRASHSRDVVPGIAPHAVLQFVSSSCAEAAAKSVAIPAELLQWTRAV